MTREFLNEDLENLEKMFRATFINSLGGYKSVVLVGTCDSKGQENLAIFNSFFHIGANPALCGIIVRPSEVPRHTLNNILEKKHYTINHIREDFLKNAHQTSARYHQNESEFEAAKLTPEYKNNLQAPFVKESKIKFACELQQKIDLEINGTTLLIGKIIYVSVPDDVVAADGYIDLEAAGSLTVSGLDSYHKTTRIERLSYAKKDKWPEKL